MRKKFSLFEQLETNLETIENIDSAIKITLGPTGKNGIVSNQKGDLKFLTSGSLLIKSLEFKTAASNVILKLIEQSANKSSSISGDGSTTTILIACQLLKTSLKFLINGYNPIIINNGLTKILYFLMNKILDYSKPVETISELTGILKTSLGKKINKEFLELLEKSLSNINKDGVILVEENKSTQNEIEIVQGIELDKGFASSYFVNELNTFETIYENPYILIANSDINSLNQIREIIEFVKKNNQPLVIIAEKISKDIISTLVLNNIQKKLKIAVINYSSISFIKDGILEDLATLTYSNYFISLIKNEQVTFKIEDLGKCEKVIIKKDKSTFIVSKFVKLIAQRRINELNRELLNAETEYEKTTFKNRIARLSGQILKIKIGLSNKYQIEEERQKVENAITTVKSSLEEGILPGGGSFYFHLTDSVHQWSLLNLIGDEFFSSQIINESLRRPFKQLLENTNNLNTNLIEELKNFKYPTGYDLIKKKFFDCFKEGLLDSTKSIRAILWNSITIVSTIITSD